MKTLKYSTLFAAILILFATGVYGQNVKPESVVDISSKSSAKKVAEGTLVTLNVILNIKDSWHINANKPTDESLTPTKVKFSKSSEYSVTRIKYPPAEMLKLPFSNQELALYEMQATVKTGLLVDKNFKGKTITVKGTLQYQPCNNQTCLFPVSKPFSLVVSLK